jgi:hypothetical protein
MYPLSALLLQAITLLSEICVKSVGFLVIEFNYPLSFILELLGEVISCLACSVKETP